MSHFTHFKPKLNLPNCVSHNFHYFPEQHFNAFGVETFCFFFFFFLTLSRAAVVLIFFTVAKKRGGVGRGADSTISNCISGTKPVFVQSCMRTESQRGQWAESLMAHNPDFTL